MDNNFNQEHLFDICKSNNVNYIGIFGSQSRGDAKVDSDIDLLVDFDQTKSLFELSHLKTALENLLKGEVDITLRKNIKKTIKPFVLNDLNTLYDKRF